jgi:predicted MPP superfamily phosphohydrolase
MSHTSNGRGPWLQIGSLHGFEWNRLDVTVEQLPARLQNLRIVHLTDLHVGRRWFAAYDHLIARLSADIPDLILFTGDFVDHVLDHRPALPILERLLTQLRSRLGIYAVTGNHDGDLLGPRLPRWGVHLLNGRYERLESEHASIELIGLPGVRRRNFDPEFVAGVPARQQAVPRIVLAHFPDQVALIGPLAPDVMLSGHTHGGQICLPNRRALITHDTLPKHMAHGCHRFGRTLLVVNRGFGMTRWPIRIFCPAEVIELRLAAASGKEPQSPPIDPKRCDEEIGPRASP